MLQKTICLVTMAALFFSCLDKDNEAKTQQKNPPSQAVEQEAQGPGDSGGGGMIKPTKEEVLKAISETQFDVAQFGLRNMLTYLTDLTSSERKALILILNPSAKEYIDKLFDMNQSHQTQVEIEERLATEWQQANERADFSIDPKTIGAHSQESYISQSILQTHRPLEPPTPYIRIIKPEFEEKDYCFSIDKDNALASVDRHDLKANLCFSIKYLMELPKNSLKSEIAGLWVHELAHMAGFREDMATTLQNRMSKNYDLYVPSYYSPESTWFRQQFDEMKENIFYSNKQESIEGFIDQISKRPEYFVSEYENTLRMLRSYLNSGAALRICKVGHAEGLIDDDLSQMRGKLHHPLWLAGNDLMTPEELIKLYKMMEWQLDAIKRGNCSFGETDYHKLSHLTEYIASRMTRQAKIISFLVHDLVEVEFLFFHLWRGSGLASQQITGILNVSRKFRMNLSLRLYSNQSNNFKSHASLNDDIKEFKGLYKQIDDPKIQKVLESTIRRYEKLNTDLQAILDSELIEVLDQEKTIRDYYLGDHPSQKVEASALLKELEQEIQKTRRSLLQALKEFTDEL